MVARRPLSAVGLVMVFDAADLSQASLRAVADELKRKEVLDGEALRALVDRAEAGVDLTSDTGS